MTLRPPTLNADEARLIDRHAISRRSFLARSGGAVLGATAFGSLLAACGGGDGGQEENAAVTEAAATQAGGATEEAAGAATGTVKLLCWQGYDDAKAAEPLTSKGVTVSPEYITNNDEIVTKLRGGAVGSIDLVTPYFGYIKPLYDGGLLEPIDYSRLPSTNGYFPEFNHPEWNTFDSQVYSAPLVWGDTPIVYRSDLFTDLPKSWLDLKDAKYKGQLVTLDDALGNIIIYAKVLYGGDNATKLTKAQLDDVMKVWKEIKPNLVTIAPSFGDVADILTRGDAAACLEGWRFVEVQLGQKGKDAASYVPSEGTFAWADSYCIAKDPPNPDAAYAFIETMISAQGDAIVGANTGSAVTNKDAVANLPPEQSDLYPYKDIDTYLQTSGFYGLPPLEPEGDLATFKDWQTAWEDLKSA